jgi:hypothetical protein
VGKERWQEIRNSGLCSAGGEVSCSLSCRRGSSYHSPFFVLKERGRGKIWVLGHSLILWLLPAGRERHMFSGGVLRVWCLYRGYCGGPVGGPRKVDILGGGVD